MLRLIYLQEERTVVIMADSSDNDDLPDLVESSDEDSSAEKKVKKTNGKLFCL